MALITLMVFNAPIMAISLSQPNSPHSMNETLGLLHSISTPRDTTFGEDNRQRRTQAHTPDILSSQIRDSTSPPPDQVLSPDSWVPTPA